MNKGVTEHTLDRNNPEEVSIFLDGIIKQVEQMVSEIGKKDRELAVKEQEIAKRDKRIQELLLELEHIKKSEANNMSSENMEIMLSQALDLVEENARKIEENAQRTSEMIIEEAKKNADRIVNESLLRAEKTEMEANMLRRNIRLFKTRVKQLIVSEQEIVDDIEKANF